MSCHPAILLLFSYAPCTVQILWSVFLFLRGWLLRHITAPFEVMALFPSSPIFPSRPARWLPLCRKRTIDQIRPMPTVSWALFKTAQVCFSMLQCTWYSKFTLILHRIIPSMKAGIILGKVPMLKKHCALQQHLMKLLIEKTKQSRRARNDRR